MSRHKRRALRERFHEKVDRSGGPDACWPWTAYRRVHGYGEIGAGGRRGRILKAHRVAYELENGPIPDGMVVRHKCDNPPCCNPAHLELGTQQDNIADMSERGRWDVNGPRNLPRGDSHPLRRRPHLAARGERVGGAKLTADDVRTILASPDSQRVLARRFRVDRRTIAFIRQGKTWKHIQRPSSTSSPTPESTPTTERSRS